MVPLLVVLALALTAPVPALAQDPLGPLPPAPAPEPAPRQAPVPTTADDGLLEGWSLVLIVGTALGLLGGISWYIVHDARRAAPAGPPRTDSSSDDAAAGSRRPPARRVQQGRARAKAARAARKRNR